MYRTNANSAISANTFVRSWLGAGFPLFAVVMSVTCCEQTCVSLTLLLRYKKLGVEWATSLLGFIAVGLFPVPVIFYFYGAKLRYVTFVDIMTVAEWLR